MFTQKEIIEWSSAALVVLCGAVAGHYAAVGMNMIQWAGAATAVLGSVTVAVAVRLWPAKAPAKSKQD